MKRVRTVRAPYRSAFVVMTLVAVGIGLIATPACSNQGEGERCDSLNGNDDCKTDEGLSCYQAKLLNGTSSDRCCPTDRNKATHPVCLTPVDIVGVDSSTPADTGPTPTADANVNDTGSDASTTTDASDASDAPNDG